jgi:hypothetical protein
MIKIWSQILIIKNNLESRKSWNSNKNERMCEYNLWINLSGLK